MVGNVREWTSDWFQAHGDAAHGCCAPVTPAAATATRAATPRPAAIPRKVMKGGSHLCAPNHCRRYRMAQPVDTGTSHLGFRCVVRGAASTADE